MEPVDVLTEFSHLLDSYEISDDETRKVLTDLVAQCLEEKHWRNLEDRSLLNLLFESISLYGQTSWEPFAQVIAPVYLYAMEHLPVDARRDLQCSHPTAHRVQWHLTECPDAFPFSRN